MKRLLFYVWGFTLILSGSCLAQQVDTLWTKHYDYRGADDFCNDMALDDSGNCYVTGEGMFGIVFNAVTIKRKSNGDTAWVRVYRSNGSGVTQPVALALDASRNVVITGMGNESISNSPDITTVKYRFDGGLAWMVRYDGQPGSNYGSTDEANDVAVDASGNIYVTGSCDSSTIGGLSDLVTIKYSPLGETLWVRRYDAAADSDIGLAVAVDGSGNVVVAGVSRQSGAMDLVTLKYSSTGSLLWTRRLPANVYTSEYSTFPVWHPVTLSIDASNNTYIATNVRQNRRLLVKYGPIGNLIWADSSGSCTPYASTLDAQGNFYVTGTNGSAALTFKWKPDGSLCWCDTFRGPENRFTVGRSLSLDGNRNVYVTGRTSRVAGGMDIFTVKYDTSGVFKWSTLYDGTGSMSGDLPSTVIVGGSGDIWVSGTSLESSTGKDFLTVKYREKGSGVEDNVGPNDQKLEIKIKAKPNPFTTFAVVSGLEREHFALYNISGELVGIYKGNRIGEGLAPGVYFLRQEGNNTRPLRIVKVR